MSLKKFYPLALGLFLFVSCKSELSHFQLPAIISDNMVLQQNQEVVLWGRAKPDSKVKVQASWNESVEVKADKDSCWCLRLKTPNAGGPYELTFKNSDSVLIIQNIMIGEVWLCTGQSNMEMPLAGWPPNDTILNSSKEIAQADYPSIRMFTVQKAYSFAPETDCQGNWQVCNPANAANYSATAYFFGLKLHQELNIPIGLIHSSWGGTPVESWISKEKLLDFSEYGKTITQLDSLAPKVTELEKWLNALPTIKPDMDSKDPWAKLNFNDSEVSLSEFDDSKWKTMVLPGNFENSEIGQFDGAVWFRKSVVIPDKWIGRDLVLELGPIDDVDITYFNGEFIGSHEMDGEWQTFRKYTISSKKFKSGPNTIAVRVIDSRGGGGIYGKEADLNIYPADKPMDKIALKGEWRFLPVAIYFKNTFKIFDIPSQSFYSMNKLPLNVGPYTPSMLFNGMINPLIPYSIKGAIWYQGESNVGQAELYSRTFPAMIENWRKKWGQGDFPFYYVQIAPYDYGNQGNSAALREAQFKSLTLKNTGMVVTLDIGNPVNIHPANKQDVGYRLASWALAKDYGKNVHFSGPLYKSMEIKDDAIIIHFDFTDGGLSGKHGVLDNFEIAGSDQKFVKANAVIEGNTVIVKSSRVSQPFAVRYLWNNTSIASLFNGIGLPASSFRTDTW